MCALELDSLQLPPKMPAVSHGSPNSATVITEKCRSVFDDPGLSPPIDEAFSTNLDAIAVMQANKAGAPFCAMKDSERSKGLFLRESLVYLVVSSLSLAALLFLSRQVMAGSPSPLDVIQSGTERGLQIIKSSLSGEGPALQQRRNEILKIVDEYFEFGEMSRRSLGRPWKEQTPDKQSEFVRLFKQLLFNTYVSRVEAAATPTTRIVYESEKVEGDYALVKTRAINDQKPAVQIDYRVHLDSAGWKVYDVVIEGVSLVSNYREQFASILSSEPFDSLLKRLREKVAAQAPL